MHIPPTRLLTQAPPNHSKRRRRISKETLSALLSGAERQRLALNPDDPRVRPTMPALRFLLELGGGK
jgi:hypothetical protein